MIHLIKSFKEKKRLTFPEYHGNHLISWKYDATSSDCGISSLVRQSHLSAALPFLCKRVFTSLHRGTGLNWTACWVESGSEEPGSPRRRCPMKTFDRCRTLVSGQAVDTRCQELNGTQPSSRDIRSGGSYINTASWPPLLTPGAPHVSFLPWPSRPRHSAELHMLQVSLTERWIDGQTYRPSHISRGWRLCFFAVAVTLSRVGLISGMTLSFKPQGTRLQVRLYSDKMDGPGTCCGLSLAPRQFYQFRLNLGSQLQRITFAATPESLPLVPPLWGAGEQRSIFTKVPGEAKWETCMGLSGPIQELFVSTKQDMPLKCCSSPLFASDSAGNRLTAVIRGFDLTFCESGQSSALGALWRYRKRILLKNWWRWLVVTKERDNLLTSSILNSNGPQSCFWKATHQFANELQNAKTERNNVVK